MHMAKEVSSRRPERHGSRTSRKAPYEDDHDNTPHAFPIAADRRLLACGQLSLCGTNLSLRQSVAQRAVATAAHQATSAGPLGDNTWSQFTVRPSQPRH